MPDTDYFFEDKEQVEESKKRRLENRKSNLEGHLGIKKQLKVRNTEQDEEEQNDDATPVSDNVYSQLKAISGKGKEDDDSPNVNVQTDKRRRESVVVEEALKRRQSVHELGQKGFIKNPHIARRLQPAATDLEDLIENRMGKQQMESLGLVRRTSLANSLQPKAEALETLIQKRHVDQSPTEIQLSRQDSSFKHEVAPSLTAAAKAVNRKRMSFKLNQALTGRRDYQELVDDGIAFSERVAPTLHARAFTLEERLKERVTEHYLKIKGVLPARLDLDNALQSVAGTLQKQLERRPSLLENDEFVRNVLGRVDIDSIKPDETQQNEEESPMQDKKSILEEKLDRERRPSYVELQNKNILKKSFNPKVDAMANASAKAELERHALEQNLKFQLASRRDPEDMVDSGYLFYPPNDQRALSPGLHGVAHELQENLEERPPEDYLVRKGIIQKDVQDWSLDQYAVRDNLTSRLSVRPPKAEVARKGLIPQETPVSEEQQQPILNNSAVPPHANQQPQQQHYHDDDDEDLNDESSQGPQHEEEPKSIKNPPQSQSQPITQSRNQNQSQNQPQSQSQQNANATQQQPRSFAYQTKQPKTRDVPQLIHQDVHEPLLQVDVLVPEPELNDATIKSSPLAFMNVLDSLKDVSDSKISVANQYIEQMKDKATKLFEVKSLFQKIEKYGLDHLDVEFQSCGDVDADLENLKNEIIQLQTDLFKLDETYEPVHKKLREISQVEGDLEKYQDEYYSSIVQLRRVHSRINQVLQEHQIQRDSAITALQATELQQGFMKSKISDKIAETLVKIDTLQQQLAEARQERVSNQSYATVIAGLYSTYFSQQQENEQKSPKETELEEELNMCNNFLTGLNEFLKGLKKLRKEQRNRITHLEQVIEQLHNQRAAVAEKIGNSEVETIRKLRNIRLEFVAPLKQQIEKNNQQQKSALEEEDERSKSSRGPALSVEHIVTKRVNRMNQVYRKLQDLESRAMTTGSREYLRGLTEIRELQLIMGNQYLKYFFIHFVSKANQVFHDFQLASMALMEQTSTVEDPMILELTGIKTLIRVLERNKRTVHLAQDIEEMMRFVEAMPDREIVIMQVARHLAMTTPYKHFITGKHRPQSMMPSLPENDNRDLKNSYVILELFATKLLEEWVGSIFNTYGKSTTTSVRAALEDDVIAQVRPSNAARLIVNCVWGLDGYI